MGDLLQFPEPRDQEIDRLINLLERAGMTVGIIRNGNNWKGELAFSMLGMACHNTPQVIAAMIELNVKFNNDAALAGRCTKSILPSAPSTTKPAPREPCPSMNGRRRADEHRPRR